MDTWLNSLYLSATDAHHRHEYALGGLANLLLWVSWLRGGEAFSLEWQDLHVIWPPQGPEHDLPPGTGALLLRLLPETKSSRSLTADVVLSLTTLSGLDLGRWIRRVHAGDVPSTGAAKLFVSLNGVPWNSQKFRRSILYP
jgi:hypothetical protein